MAEPLSRPLRVRYAECDMQGVVFNAHYLAWFDDNMTELWRASFGGYHAAVERGLDIVVAEAQLRYRASARFDEELTLGVAVSHLGTTSVITRHTVQRGEQLLVEGTLRHVTVAPGALTKLPIPDWMREALGPWTVLAEQAAAAGPAAG